MIVLKWIFPAYPKVKKNKAFNFGCVMNKNGQAKTPPPPPARYLMVAPLDLLFP